MRPGRKVLCRPGTIAEALHLSGQNRIHDQPSSRKKYLMELKNYYNDIKGRKVLVLGGLGFVGHNLVKTLVTDYNCDVTCLDNNKNSSDEVLGPVRDKVRLVIEDVRNLGSWSQLLHEADYVFHLACIQVAHS